MARKRRARHDVGIHCPGCGKIHHVKKHKLRGFLRHFARQATIEHGRVFRK